MTPQETAALLVMLNGAWPWLEITEATTIVWATELAQVDPDDALATAHLLIRSPGRFPSVGEFLEASRPITRRRIEAEARTIRGELESGDHLTREERKANVARLVTETKKIVAANRARSPRFRPHT